MKQYKTKTYNGMMMSKDEQDRIAWENINRAEELITKMSIFGKELMIGTRRI